MRKPARGYGFVYMRYRVKTARLRQLTSGAFSKFSGHRQR
jgi:hypothetical protein